MAAISSSSSRKADLPGLAGRGEPRRSMARTWRHHQADRRIVIRQQRILIPQRARQPNCDVADTARPLPPAGGAAFLRLAYIVIGGADAAGPALPCLTGVSDAASGDHSD